MSALFSQTLPFLVAILYELSKWEALLPGPRHFLLISVEPFVAILCFCWSRTLTSLGVVNWTIRILALLCFVCGFGTVGGKGAPPLSTQYLHMVAMSAFSSLLVATVVQAGLAIAAEHKPSARLSILVAVAGGIFGGLRFALTGEHWVFGASAFYTPVFDSAG